MTSLGKIHGKSILPQNLPCFGGPLLTGGGSSARSTAERNHLNPCFAWAPGSDESPSQNLSESQDIFL